MINSNARKLTLSTWLRKHQETEYNSSLKLQKFLLLYESVSKVNGDDKADFSHLRGYKNGPVFSNVWGDYTKERQEFERLGDICYERYGSMLNHQRALQCGFIVSILSEHELSSLTYEMNIWKKQKDLILKGIYQVSLKETDFNDDDRKLIEKLSGMYPVELAETSSVINLDSYHFVLSREDMLRLTEEHIDVLCSLTQTAPELHNPVYVEIDEDGRLVID